MIPEEYSPCDAANSELALAAYRATLHVFNSRMIANRLEDLGEHSKHVVARGYHVLTFFSVVLLQGIPSFKTIVCADVTLLHSGVHAKDGTSWK